MGKKYRGKKYSDNEIQSFLNDIYMVGPQKPLGYLPTTTLKELCKKDPKKVEEELEERGLTVFIFEDGESRIPGGSVYVFHEESIKKLLLKYRETLIQFDWPQEPWDFVFNVAHLIAPGETKLYDLIADCFADKTNSRRTDRKKRV